MMSARRILSIGQCTADQGAIARALQQTFLAEVVPASTADEALLLLGQELFALVLVNRILDADGSEGLDVIRRIKADEKLASVPVMLVSNHEEVQTQAVKAGAVAGFGKAALRQPQTLARLKPFLG